MRWDGTVNVAELIRPGLEPTYIDLADAQSIKDEDGNEITDHNGTYIQDR